MEHSGGERQIRRRFLFLQRDLLPLRLTSRPAPPKEHWPVLYRRREDYIVIRYSWRAGSLPSEKSWRSRVYRGLKPVLGLGREGRCSVMGRAIPRADGILVNRPGHSNRTADAPRQGRRRQDDGAWSHEKGGHDASCPYQTRVHTNSAGWRGKPARAGQPRRYKGGSVSGCGSRGSARRYAGGSNLP